MEKDDAKVLGWVTIILILLGVGLFTGMLLGLLGNLLGLPAGMTTAGIGLSMGIMAAILITRRRAAIARKNNR